MTVHGQYLHLHGPFEIRIGDDLCPSVVVYVWIILPFTLVFPF